MPYTIEEYNALSSAITSGTSTVEYGDKKVTYRSLSEMLRIKQMMEKELYPNRTTKRKLAEYGRGF